MANDESIYSERHMETTTNFIPGRTLSDIFESKTTGMILISIVILTVLDITVDLFQGVDPIHIVVEATILPLAGWGLYVVWRGQKMLTAENVLLKTNVEQLSADATLWRNEAGRYLNGLTGAIDAQLNRWNLSKAEKEIALLLLKGLSHKEIAQIRNTSERTARQQALAVYEKSNLGGRAELSAFFLEDLLVLPK
jgi:DNA-binding CsgD family transcriptional regulator